MSDKDPRRMEQTLDFHSSVMQLVISTRQAIKSMPDTLAQAHALLAKGAGRDVDEEEPLPIPSENVLRRNLLYLDDALDCHLRDKIRAAQGEGRLCGVGLATDESPPSQPRFRGLRFQVKMLYFL